MPNKVKIAPEVAPQGGQNYQNAMQAITTLNELNDEVDSVNNLFTQAGSDLHLTVDGAQAAMTALISQSRSWQETPGMANAGVTINVTGKNSIVTFHPQAKLTVNPHDHTLANFVATLKTQEARLRAELADKEAAERALASKAAVKAGFTASNLDEIKTGFRKDLESSIGSAVTNAANAAEYGPDSTRQVTLPAGTTVAPATAPDVRTGGKVAVR